MIIGFGKTEADFEEAEEAAILTFAKELYIRDGLIYVTNEFSAAIKEWCAERGAALQAKADAYKDAATYPDRYSYYWPRVLHSASDTIVILTFHHVNRRHALSPDGWALMRTERLVHFNSLDVSVKRALTEEAA